MRGFSKFCQRRPNFDNVLFIFIFLVDEGKEDPNTTISGRADDGPSLNAGLVALWFLGDPEQYFQELLYFCDFSEGVRTSMFALDPRMSQVHSWISSFCRDWPQQVLLYVDGATLT